MRTLENESLFELKSKLLSYQVKRKFSGQYTENDTKKDALIYHYTDLNGLIGIVEGQCFFASDIRFVNDKSELTYALDLLQNVSRRYSDRYLFLSHLESHKEIHFPPNRYITCFSTEGDLLQQWRNYGHNCEGVSIGFNYKINGTSPRYLMPTAISTMIIYDVDRQVDILERSLKDIIGFFDENYNDWTEERYAAHVASVFVDEISLAISSFKDSEFLYEKECRFFHEPNINNQPRKYFRSRKKLILPYIKLETTYKFYEQLMKEDDNKLGAMPTILPENRLLPIKEIIVGSELEYESLKEGIKILLTENRYKDVKIIKSKQNFRP